MSIVARLWNGDDVAARAFRVATWPLASLYQAAVAVRTGLYDRGWLATHRTDVPVASIGNLTVGGTGKTPVAAWLAARLARDAHPAIVIRGYGADEIAVHRELNPDIPVIVNPDRVAGIVDARASGADVVVLDDAFQHRRAGRNENVLLLSAEQLRRSERLLPSGPWREPLSAARRATLIVITRKSASDADAMRARDRVRGVAPGVPVASVRLAPAELVSVVGDERRPVEDLRGRPVLAIAAIGEPELFAEQLGQLGARVTLEGFRDHHEFTAEEAERLSRAVPAEGLAVCTLKDAVKLRGWWPPRSRLWYVSQQLVVEYGESELERVIERLLAARATDATHVG
jgi:tetraacyldisaccharide 4'-kinase